MTNEIVSAFILGLIGGVIPGPVLTATFTEVLQSGFLKSLRIVFLAMFAETIVALISLIALSSLGLPQSVFMALSFVGAGILFWISASIWKIDKIDADKQIHFSLGKIFAMILANGMLWTYWITVCIPKAISLNEKIYAGQFLFLLLVEIGWLFSTVFVAWIFSRFRKILSNPKIVSVLFKIFSLTFIYFALSMCYQSFKFFVG